MQKVLEGRDRVGWGVSVSFLSHPSLGTLTVWLVLSLCFSRCIAKHLPFTLSKGRASAPDVVNHRIFESDRQRSIYD